MGIGSRCRQLSIVFLITCSAVYSNAQRKKDFHFSASQGVSILIVNGSGPVSVQPVSEPKVVIRTIAASDKVTVDAIQNGNRIELRTRLLQDSDPREQRVEYQVQAPADAILTVRSSDGPITVEGLTGDVTLEGESAAISARGLNDAHLHVHSVSGPVTLSSIKNAYVDVISVGGKVDLREVTGPRVLVNTSSGDISYFGDFSGGGTYSFTDHVGNIVVELPASASVDLTARSLGGNIKSNLPLQPKPATPHAFVPEGKSLSGVFNSGASSVKLNTFKGSITISKQ